MEEFFPLDTRSLDRARSSRDARFDGKFFIAVTSTKIYCRPVCPVRDAKRSNVRYYPTAAAAAEAGFRPCLRCRPEAAPGSPAWSGTGGAVRRGLRLIEEGYLDENSVEDLAQKLGIGSRHLHRLFVEHVGASPVAVAQTRRLHFAKRLLDETNFTITSVALAAGFGSVRRFNEVFRLTYRRSPRDIRRARPLESAVSGMDEVILRLAYRPPYDWGHLHAFLAAHAITGVEYIGNNSYSRTVGTADGSAVIQVRPMESEDALQLHVSGASPTALLHLSATARRVFDLAADPAAITHAFANDSYISPLMKRRPGLRVPGAWNPFECVVRAIVSQQKKAPEARAILGRLVEQVGRRATTAVAGLTHLFPKPEDLASSELVVVGLTRNTAAAVRRFATAVIDGKIDFTATPEEVVHQLISIPGIDAGTAQYVALRALGEPDAFPADDLVLRRVSGNGHGAISASAMAAIAEAWRPWRAYAAVHLWCAADEAAEKPHEL